MDTFIDTIKIADRKLKLERIKNLDVLVDQVSDTLFNQDERLPYWAELWPSSRALSAWVLQKPGLLRDRSILELGCGLGLTSLAVTLCGPSSFLATDYEEDALEALKRNFELNGITPPETGLLDWRDFRLEQCFDCIVASDVAYEQRFFEPLISLFARLLKKGGEVLLAEPNRTIARSFFGKLAMSGFTFTSNDITVLQDGHEIRVTIYRIRFA